MNNSSTLEGKDNSSPLLVLSVNISMAVVALAFLSHLTAVFVLFRDTQQRKKIMSPFMINLSVISLVVSAGDYAVTMGADFKKKTQNSTKTVFLCSWVAFVGLLSRAAYSSTLCLMNIVSNLAADRCSRGVCQQITRTSTIIVFVASWLHAVAFSGMLLFEASLSSLSASQLTCQLNWSSQEKFHFIYNATVVTTTMLLPMVTCFVMQYHCTRIWKNSRHIENVTRKRGLKYRRKMNRMVIALTLVFFIFELPGQIGNVVAMVTGHYSYTHKVAFVLETVAQSNVLYAPWVYVFLNTSYRLALKKILTSDGSGQTLSGARGNAPRRYVHQGVGTNRNAKIGTNRNAEEKRVKFADNKVAPLRAPVDGTSKQTNLQNRTTGLSNLTSRESTGSSCQNKKASRSADATIKEGNESSEQSTEH